MLTSAWVTSFQWGKNQILFSQDFQTSPQNSNPSHPRKSVCILKLRNGFSIINFHSHFKFWIRWGKIVTFHLAVLWLARLCFCSFIHVFFWSHKNLIVWVIHSRSRHNSPTLWPSPETDCHRTAKGLFDLLSLSDSICQKRPSTMFYIHSLYKLNLDIQAWLNRHWRCNWWDGLTLLFFKSLVSDNCRWKMLIWIGLLFIHIFILVSGEART